MEIVCFSPKMSKLTKKNNSFYLLAHQIWNLSNCVAVSSFSEIFLPDNSVDNALTASLATEYDLGREY